MKSLTLIEVLVAVALFSIVFFGIFGAFWLASKIVGLQERKITATQIAQGEIEKMRNLSYLEVGTINAQLPYAQGILEDSTTTILNGVEYKIERKIKFVSDLADGDEECPLDYKKAQVKVSFSGFLKGEVVLETEISPKDKVEEAQACQEQPAGILSTFVFDAKGEAVSSPKIEIFDPDTGNLIDSAEPSSGNYDFPLSPGKYKVVVSKEGYSQERTYGIDEIAIPQKPHPIVLEGEITQISFSIDKVSSILVKTLSPWGEGFFADSFLDESKVSEKENVKISEGEVKLASSTEGYATSGYVISVEISPSDLLEWENFSFTDDEPDFADLKYQILFASDTEWYLIPDSDLPGNSQGFDESPVDLSLLSTSTYSKLKLKANFSTESSLQTPTLFDWQFSFKTSGPTPIPNVNFNLRGEKLIGYDEEENPVYKYDKDHQTDSSGKILISNLEWDIYRFSNFQKDSQDLDLVTSTPPIPLSLEPATDTEVDLYLESQNSLLVTVQDSETLNPIFSATCTLSSLDYEETQYTDEKGQTLFIPLESKTYTLSVEATGYYSTTSQVFISGRTSKTIKLSPSE